MRVASLFVVGCMLLFTQGCDESSDVQVPQTPAIRVPDWNYVQGKYFFLVNPNGQVPPPENVINVRLYLELERTVWSVPTRWGGTRAGT